MFTTHSDHDHHHDTDSSILDQYIALMSDIPHLMVEMTFVLIHILAFEVIRRFFKQWTNKRLEEEHHRLDKEHGVEHQDEFTKN